MVRHLKDGEDFGAQHFAAEKDFGFTGSAQGYDPHPVAPPFAGARPTDNGQNLTPYARGGAHHMQHMHPHGHRVVRVEHRHDGSVVHHHAHGGHSIHHAHGGITHHDAMGGMCHAQGGAHMSDEMQDKAMVAKGIHQHENHEHHGEHTDLHLARGGRHRHPKEGSAAEERGESPEFEAHEDEGMARGGHAARIPRGMRPKATHEHPIGAEMAMNRPPRSPKRSPTTRNAMPGDAMGMGVEPSAEPDMPPGGDGGAPMLRRGGRMGRHRA
jgi:hypothetical protein